MEETLQAQSVYQLVVEALVKYGVDPVANEVNRRILLVNRNFIGQRFECDGYRAVWLADQGIIRFYGPDGIFLQTLAAPATSWIRQAAA